MKGIYVTDDALDAATQYAVNISAHGSSLYIGWEDKDWGTGAADKFIYSQWDIEDVKACGILNSPKIGELLKLGGLSISDFDKAILNIDTVADAHWNHTHPDKTILLYYMLEDWEDGWAGETLYFDKDNIREVYYCSRYVPNRAILFDGNIPHSIRAPSRTYPHKYRYTLALIFNKRFTLNDNYDIKGDNND
jgi:hypothetical protein